MSHRERGPPRIPGTRLLTKSLSFAHPTKGLLDALEAMLVINIVRTIGLPGSYAGRSCVKRPELRRAVIHYPLRSNMQMSDLELNTAVDVSMDERTAQHDRDGAPGSSSHEESQQPTIRCKASIYRTATLNQKTCSRWLGIFVILFELM